MYNIQTTGHLSMYVCMYGYAYYCMHCISLFYAFVSPYKSLSCNDALCKGVWKQNDKKKLKVKYYIVGYNYNNNKMKLKKYVFHNACEKILKYYRLIFVRTTSYNLNYGCVLLVKLKDSFIFHFIYIDFIPLFSFIFPNNAFLTNFYCFNINLYLRFTLVFNNLNFFFLFLKLCLILFSILVYVLH